MTFSNPVDYPDFIEPGQAGSGLIWKAIVPAIGTFGPFYIGNMPSFTINVTSNLATGQIQFIQQDNPVLGVGFPWGVSQYTMQAGGTLYDEVKAVAPYLFVVNPGEIVDIAVGQGSGQLGAPGTNFDNALFANNGQTIGPGAVVTYTVLNQIPGPAIATVACHGGGTAAVAVIAATNLASAIYLGGAVAAPTFHTLSVASVSVILPNMLVQVQAINTSANNDVTFETVLMSSRGY